MGEISLGKNSYSYAERRGTNNSVYIGNYCSIAENVIFDGGFNHRTDFITTFPLHKIWSELPSNIKPAQNISIGHDVWIGEGAIINQGIAIGTGSIIGARTIVTKNVEPYSVVVGAPMRVIKKRFTDQQIEKLLKLAWWEWDDNKVLNNADLLLSNNINELLNKHK